MTLLMPVSCHLDRCFCKLDHNTKAIQNRDGNFFTFHEFLLWESVGVKTFDSLLDANARPATPRQRVIRCLMDCSDDATLICHEGLKCSYGESVSNDRIIQSQQFVLTNSGPQSILSLGEHQ